MRLNLARALMSRADLLLLDEPTNHLDLDAVVWLERWLAGFRGTLLVISHDREFLDGCVSHIAHIAERRLALYTGNYSAFETQRASQLALQQVSPAAHVLLPQVTPADSPGPAPCGSGLHSGTGSQGGRTHCT